MKKNRILLLITLMFTQITCPREWPLTFYQPHVKQVKEVLSQPKKMIPGILISYIGYKGALWYLNKIEFSKKSNNQLLEISRKLYSKIAKDYGLIYEYLINNETHKSIDITISSDVSQKAKQKKYWTFITYKYSQDLEEIISKLSKLGAELLLRSKEDHFNQEEFLYYSSLIEQMIPKLQLINKGVQATSIYNSERSLDGLIQVSKYTLLYFSTLFSLYCICDYISWLP